MYENVYFKVDVMSCFSSLKRLALFESALFAVRNGLQQITSTAQHTGHKIPSEAESG